jgi:hypothetical protein
VLGLDRRSIGREIRDLVVLAHACMPRGPARARASDCDSTGGYLIEQG